MDRHNDPLSRFQREAEHLSASRLGAVLDPHACLVGRSLRNIATGGKGGQVVLGGKLPLSRVLASLRGFVCPVLGPETEQNERDLQEKTGRLEWHSSAGPHGESVPPLRASTSWEGRRGKEL